MNIEKLEEQLELEEGCRLDAYHDTKWILTVGIGHNCIARPVPGVKKVGDRITEQQKSELFEDDIEIAGKELDDHLSWWRGLDDVRQNALLNLSFNMGINGLLTFKNTLSALKAEDYLTAANGIRRSQYARDVGPTRSGRVAKMIETGEWQL